VDLVVRTSRAGAHVDGFGACSPTPCEWGLIPATVYGPTVTAKTGTSLEAQWNFGFSRTVLLVTLSFPRAVPTLTVTELTTFTDGSGRSNYVVTEKLVKGRAVAVTKSGTPGTDYPLGDTVTPAAKLPGIWINPAASGNIRAVILSLGPSSGLLEVHAFGYCSPLCNWGTVPGIVFGPSVTATTGGTFLAPYHFLFAKKLLEGSLNPAGDRLTVQAWTEFTDASGRSNYKTTETLIPLR
jgi:hypothetical protein